MTRDSGSGAKREDAPAAEAEGPQSGAAKTAHRPNSPHQGQGTMTKHPEALKLLPCPFCGGEPYVIEDTSYNTCGIGCHCQAEPYIDRVLGGLDEAKAAWNTRASLPPAQDMREVVRKCADWLYCERAADILAPPTQPKGDAK